MNNEQEIDIVQIAKTCWKKKNILLAIIGVFFVLGVLYTFIINRPMYKSTIQILIDKADASISQFVISNDIITEVSDKLGVQNSYISGSVTATFEPKTKIIIIEASSKNNSEAYNMVNKYQEVVKTKLETVYGVKAYNIIEQPVVSNDAYNINHIKDLLIFLVIGVVVCGVYCIFLVTFSGTNILVAIQNAKITLLGKISIEEKTKSKVKAYITKNERNIAQIKRVMTNIELNKRLPRPKTILITSPNYGAGTTYVVSNLAMRYSKSSRRVLIIDSNFRSGIEHKIFNIKNAEIGLSDLIEKKEIYEEDIARTIKQTPISNIFVLPHGAEDVDEELLVSDKIHKIINLIKNSFDIIIIDGEPILKQITSYGWANSVDATVIVAEFSKTNIDDIIKSKRTIEDIGGKVSGVVVNKAD